MTDPLPIDTGVTPRSDSSVDWLRRAVLPAVAVAVCVLVYAFGVHMQRMIVFDEIGLHNPVYTFVTTGRMTYPMHGHPEFMVVHPPTHYAITATLMKAGIPLFAASAVPLIAYTLTLAAIIVTGPFSPAVGVGLLLGYFVSLTTWSEFYTLRPDLHVTAAWFTALVVLESARLTGWRPWRMFVGALLAVLAAAVHYWAVSALLLPAFYLALAVWQRRRSAGPQVAAVAAGGLVVGLPFLVWFVVPFYDPIMLMVASVQGDGTPFDAYARHLLSYGAFAQRLPAAWDVRWLSALLAAPALLLKVPAVFLAIPLLAVHRETRGLAFAGAVLPLFVLFLSQGKQVGYTGYFTPEFVLLFTGLLVSLLVLIDRIRPQQIRRTLWLGAAAVIVSAVALAGIPTSMGAKWSWTGQLDTLDVLRGAAKRVTGPTVALTSAGVWYMGGGTFIWNAFNEIAQANRLGHDPVALLERFDSLLLDTNWWNARADLAPTGTWYTRGRLHLKGFVLPSTDLTRHMMQLYLTDEPVDRLRGVFVGDRDAREFIADPAGMEAFVVLSCDRPPRLETFTPSSYRFAFAYDRQPSPESPVIVLLSVRAADVSGIVERAAGCTVRDTITGRLSRLSREALRVDFAAEPPITFFSERVAALRAAGLAPRMRPAELEIPWDRIELKGASRSTSTSQLPLEVVPPEAPWAYGAVIPFSSADVVSGMTIRLEVVVTNTQAGFGVLTPDERDFVVRKFLEPSPKPQTIELTIPPIVTATGPLVIQNGERAGRAEIDIHDIDATLPAADNDKGQ